jgi:hypothetical protein
MLKQILRINETINDKLYNVSMQRKLKELLNTKDGLEILEWLVKRNLLDTATVSMDNNKMYYNAGRNDFIKWLLVIANFDDFNKLEGK